MTTQDQTSELVKNLIQTQIIAALNSGPELIEKLVKVALARPVDRQGNVEGDRNYSGWSGNMPFLDYMVGNEIRDAAQEACRKVIQEMMPNIEAEVRKGLSSDSVVAAVTKSLVNTAEHDWKIVVNFEAEKSR